MIQNSSSSLKVSVLSDMTLLATDSALADITIGLIAPAGGTDGDCPSLSGKKKTSVPDLGCGSGGDRSENRGKRFLKSQWN